MTAALRNLARLFRLARALARHDALFAIEFLPQGRIAARMMRRLWRPESGAGARPPGTRLAAALQEMGPSFIKLGQGLSTRPDLIGEAVAADLAELRDRLPPFPATVARATVEAELERPLEELFADFDDAPAAAASIAQVHFATTLEGRRVAVKILRPGIEAEFARDLDLFRWLAARIEQAGPEMRRLRPVETVAIFADTVAAEMDLCIEAAGAAELGENFAGDTQFKIPDVDWARTAKRVLTLERVGGVAIDARADLIDAGHDPAALVDAAAHAFFNQVFRDGFFHADFHPGNFFVAEDGALWAVDFGIMGRIDRKTRLFLGEMLLGFLDRDYRRVAEIHARAGLLPAKHSVDAFAQACRAIGETVVGQPLGRVSLARLLARLIEVGRRFDMRLEPQFLLLQKTMLMAEGLARGLDPEIDFWRIAQPLIAAWMADAPGAEDIRQAAAGEIRATVERLAGSIAEGGIRLHPETIHALGGKPRAPSRFPAPPQFWLWAAIVLLALLVL